jgi:toxin YoeB
MIARPGLKPAVSRLLDIFYEPPYQTPLPLKNSGNPSGAHSRRINIQHRLVYRVIEDIKTVKAVRTRTRYE